MPSEDVAVRLADALDAEDGGRRLLEDASTTWGVGWGETGRERLGHVMSRLPPFHGANSDFPGLAGKGGWRARQDSNLWPSAPEAESKTRNIPPMNYLRKTDNRLCQLSWAR